MNNVIAWASIIVGVGFLFDYIERTIKDDVRKRFAKWILDYPHSPFIERLHSLNDIFLTIFDKLYSPPSINLARHLWAGLIGALILTLIITIINNILGRSPIPTPFILSIAIVYIIVFAISSTAWTSASSKEGFKDIFIGIFTGFFFVLCLILIFQPFKEDLLPIGWWVVAGGFAGGFSVNISLIGIIIERKFRLAFSISPMRALLSSCLALLIVGLFVPEISKSFFKLAVKNNMLILSYIGLNIFADSFSLFETVCILKVARRLHPLFSPFLLICDVIFSAVIFCFLPFIIGEWNNLIASVAFSGPQTWMGLMFWSTFFTSFLFYLFVISSFLLMLLRVVIGFFSKFSNFFRVHDNPFRCLGVMAMLLITAIFIIISIF